MNTRLLLLAVVITGIGACERQPSAGSAAEERRRAEQQAADEKRIGELRELEDRAAARESAERLEELDRERDALSGERAQLEADREALQEEQRRVADARLAQIREAEQRAEERRAEQRRINQRLAEERAEAARAAEDQARAEQKMDFFYDALEPHGDWIDVERYGYCWQPKGATNPGWRPYLDGHWAFTNYGWTWVSNEPFGWATYHYGRWTRTRRLGWVWVPGSEWAPAWVSWRRSDRHVGWAPLPPEAYSRVGFTAAVERNYDIGPAHYNFVEIEKFGEPSYVGRVVEPERNITVVKQTVNVTNISYRKVENRTIIYNEGPELAAIDRHTKVRRMEVERVPQAGTPTEARGNILRMRAPFIAPSAPSDRKPARVRERVTAPEVERGWTGLAAAAMSEVREQQKEEAKKAEAAPRPTSAPAATRPAPAKPEPVKPQSKPAPSAAPVASETAPAPSTRPTATSPVPSVPANPNEANPSRRPDRAPAGGTTSADAPKAAASPAPANARPVGSPPAVTPPTQESITAPAPAPATPAQEKPKDAQKLREQKENPASPRFERPPKQPRTQPASPETAPKPGAAEETPAVENPSVPPTINDRRRIPAGPKPRDGNASGADPASATEQPAPAAAPGTTKPPATQTQKARQRMETSVPAATTGGNPVPQTPANSIAPAKAPARGAVPPAEPPPTQNPTSASAPTSPPQKDPATDPGDEAGKTQERGATKAKQAPGKVPPKKGKPESAEQ